MKTAQLYDADFAEWTRQNAELLRSGRASEADLEHIAEEIEDMGKRERRSLHNRLVRLIEHLLKWQFQPQRCGTSWQRTILVQRRAIRRLLDENPSLRPLLHEIIGAAYEDAVAFVSTVISRQPDDFPPVCPHSIDQLLDEQFLPTGG
jgi:glutamine synthetase adenylyltransferase